MVPPFWLIHSGPPRRNVFKLLLAHFVTCHMVLTTYHALRGTRVSLCGFTCSTRGAYIGVGRWAHVSSMPCGVAYLASLPRRLVGITDGFRSHEIDAPRQCAAREGNDGGLRRSEHACPLNLDPLCSHTEIRHEFCLRSPRRNTMDYAS